jgi:LPS-assembly lipoprotein
MKKIYFIFTLALLLTACGFHLQGDMHFAPSLRHIYLQTPDPYGYLSKDLQQYLRMSNVQLVDSPNQADFILNIVSDTASQVFLSVNPTQQTRQYNLVVTVVFELTNKNGKVVMPPQTLSETKPITIQSNQILSSSNEVNLYYQQMRSTLAYSIMNRIASREVTHMINEFVLNPASQTHL